MINSLQPHTVYEDVGLPWLDRVPAHWNVKRAKSVYRPVDVRSKSGGEELLTVSSSRGVVPRASHTVTMFKAASYAGYKLCWPGDLVINSLWAWGRGLGVSRHHGIISTAYGVYRVRRGYEDLIWYLHHLVRSDPFNWELHVRSKGIYKSRLQLTDTSFLNAPIPLPPPDEATAIVRFLAEMDRRINRFIRNKQRLIELLNEQKQAIITRAVTRGLVTNVTLRPSGIDWLGDVPEHWEVVPLRYCIRAGTSISYGIVQPGEHVPGGVPFVQTGNLTSLRFEASDLQRTTARIAAKFPRSRLAPGDVLLGIRASVGMTAVAPPTLEGANLSRGIARIAPRSGISGEYLALALGSTPTQTFWGLHQQGTTFNEIPISLVKQVPILIPPFEEQARLVETVNAAIAAPKRASQEAKRTIGLCEDYRARLIADVVTGKVDVRQAAAELPGISGLEVPSGREYEVLDESLM